MKTRILLTGGQGYIARNLKPLFESHEYEVLCPSKYDLNLLDIKHLNSYLKMHRFDAIIHTASRGGKRNKPDTFEEVYLPNVQMFEHLTSALDGQNIPIIIFGSGAEFDRRTSIQNRPECDIFRRWPIDPYGLSKNIITKRALTEFKNIWILRLFGCFNYDEDNARFIKSAILNLKQGLPIEVYNYKAMDFFYLDDVFTVVDYVLRNPTNTPKHMNLVYQNKLNLFTIAKIIQLYTKNYNSSINTITPTQGLDYTGDGTFLSKLPISLVGLEEGIRKTCKKLLL